MEEEDEKISKSIIGRSGSTQSDSMRAGRRNNRKHLRRSRSSL